DVGQLDLVQAADRAVAVELPHGVQQLVLDVPLEVPGGTHQYLAVELEVEEQRFGAGVGLADLHLGVVTVFDFDRVRGCFGASGRQRGNEDKHEVAVHGGSGAVHRGCGSVTHTYMCNPDASSAYVARSML